MTRLKPWLCLLMMLPASSMLYCQATATPAQSTSAQSTPSASGPSAPPSKTKKEDKSTGVKNGKPVATSELHAQRKAAKLYLKGVALLKKEQSPERTEQAWKLLQQAVELEPDNTTYRDAAALAKQSTVTQLVQQASRERDGGASSDSAKLLLQALTIDPSSPEVIEHLNQLANSKAAMKPGITAHEAISLDSGTPKHEDTVGYGPVVLKPVEAKHSFHLRASEHQIIQDVFRAYGIDASVDDSVQSRSEKLDIDDATFAEATRAVGILTDSFYEPLDPHRVIVARDTRENRATYEHQQLETLYLPGLGEKDVTSVTEVAHNVFGATQATMQPNHGTLTIRAPEKTLAAFNTTMQMLEDGKSQVDLNVKIIQLAHISDRETGATFFQQTSIYNVASEINSVLSQNQSAVQQIISSGLVPNSSTLANQIEILAILVASGDLTGTPFNQGFLPFGGGLTQSILSPGPATLTMSLNSSDTRMLDDIHLQLEDDEQGTMKIGERYPIETSSYSSVALPSSITGVSSSALSQTANETIPQVQYEDLGMTLKATPKVLRSGDVTISLDLKMESLEGSSLNDIPILNNQQFTGVLSLKAGTTAVLVSDLSKTESRALNGLPGISDIPGLEDVSDITRDQNVARLLILITPTVTRNPRATGHGPMLTLEKSTGTGVR
ncbi:hypothetical protein ACFPT7_24565 [Acidicapsa dinghuensis]|uniref:Type II/III secretion system secretin-like domain-containing protein n=1 Tax=Acidicapsa dinghuensis TaxID=2218256 RepID=A0ABW1ENX9_9BACT|nr:hypothetical protein [Acidicapsa dinghuensis]